VVKKLRPPPFAKQIRLKSCLPPPDFKSVNRTVTSPMSLIPGTLLLAVIVSAQKVLVLLGFLN
jgi:hypothetical protein